MEKRPEPRPERGVSRMPAFWTIALFLISIILVPVSGLMTGAFSGAASEENRLPAPFPEVHEVSDLLTFPEDFRAWFDDHLCYKQRLVGAKNSLEAALYGAADSEKVIFGTERPWLFNCSDDGEPLETYKRTNLFSEEALGETAENVAEMYGLFSEAGIPMILMIAPDKEEIYGADFMPKEIRVMEGPSRAEQLTEKLGVICPDLPVVYPGSALMESRKDGAVYYETDTHWNRRGAYIAARELMQTARYGDSVPAYHFRESGRKRGDLQKLVQLGEAWDSTEYDAEEAPLFEVTDRRTGQSDEVIREHALNDSPKAAPVHIYLAGDSFRWNLTRFLQDAAAESTVASRFYLDLDDVGESEPDLFVYLIAERYLQELDMIPGFNTMALQP